MPTHSPNPPLDPEPALKHRFDPVLLVIVAISAAAGALMVAKARNWAVMTDELLYTGMARSIAHTIIPLPQMRGAYIPVYQVIFPTLIAPLIGLLSMPAAYPWIAALNAVIFATAAVPAYMLTGLAAHGRAAARWVALCTVAVPWLAFASKALPDSLAYVAVLWCVYAIARTAPSTRHPLKGDLLALLAILLTVLVRNQFLFFAGVWLGVVVLVRAAETLAESGARALPRRLLAVVWQRPLPVVFFVVVVLMLAFAPNYLLGVYSVTSTGARGGAAPSGLLGAIFNHASVIGLGVAGIPLVLGLPWLTVALTRVKERSENTVAIAILLSAAAILYVGASFDVRFTEADRVIERYVFYLAPLMFVALAGLLTRPPRNLLAYVIPAGAGLLVLSASHPYGLDTRLTFEINHVFSPMQIALVQYQKVADQIGFSIFMLYAFVIVIVAAVAWWLLGSGRERAALNGVFALTAAVLLATTLYAVPKIVSTQNELIDNIFGARTTAQKSWIDEATGGAPVSLVFAPVADPTDHRKPRPAERLSNWWDLAFWNGAIDAVYAPYSPPISPLPGTTYLMKPNWQTGLLTRAPGDDSRYIAQATGDTYFAPQYSGRPTRRGYYVLYETGTGAKAAWATKGLTLRGWIPPGGAALRVWGPPAQSGVARMTIRVRTSTARAGALKTWHAKIRTGDHADFRLVRGKLATHVESIAVSRLPD